MKRLAYIPVSLAIAVFLPNEAVEPLARILVPGIALMAAGIFPSMTLVVGAMKGEQRSPKVVTDLYEKLRQILKVICAAFVLAVLAIAAILASASLNHVTFPYASYVQQVFMGLGALSVLFLVDRVVAVIRTYFAVLDLNKTQALLVARGNSEKFRNQLRESGAGLSPDDYGVRKKPLARVQ